MRNGSEGIAERAYTPTTDEVRNNMAIGVVVAAYVLPKKHSRDVDWPVPGARDRAKVQFDAWLAARDAEQREAGRLAALEEAEKVATEWGRDNEEGGYARSAFAVARAIRALRSSSPEGSNRG